jgi:hypothetical protein
VFLYRFLHSPATRRAILGAAFLSRSEVADGHSHCFSIDPPIGVSEISVRDGGIRKHRILRAIVGTASLCRFEDANTPRLCQMFSVISSYLKANTKELDSDNN